MQIPRVIGSLASGVVAYISQSWRVIWWYGAVLNTFIIPMWLFLNESPRWLLHKGYYDKAEYSINFSAVLNGTEVPEMVMEKLVESAKERIVKETKKKMAGGSISYYRAGIIWKNLIIVYIAWFSTLMVHFGLIRRSVRQDTGDIYTNFFLMNSTEIIAVIVSFVTINRCQIYFPNCGFYSKSCSLRLGRRTLLTISCGLGGLLTVACQVIWHYPTVILVLLFAGKCRLCQTQFSTF